MRTLGMTLYVNYHLRPPTLLTLSFIYFKTHYSCTRYHPTDYLGFYSEIKRSISCEKGYHANHDIWYVMSRIWMSRDSVWTYPGMGNMGDMSDVVILPGMLEVTLKTWMRLYNPREGQCHFCERIILDRREDNDIHFEILVSEWNLLLRRVYMTGRVFKFMIR